MAIAVTVCALASAQSALGACGSWQKVPLAASVRGQLVDVSASSATNVWAVGTLGQRHTLAERWNGSVWRRVATPDPSPVLSELFAVAAVGRRDVWVAGEYGEPSRPWVLDWNGSTWHRSMLPHNARFAVLRDIVAVAANDVWAVGSTGTFSATRTLHYDGRSWKVVRSPGVARDGLSSVAATSPTDVWAAGDQLLEHWDGHAWRLVPPPGRDPHYLAGIAAFSPVDALAVDSDRGAVDHWDGSSWTTAATATTGASAGLDGIAASGPTDAWVVGTNGSRTTRVDPAQPTVDHWDGAVLTEGVITDPFPAGLFSVTNVPGTTTYWAVGFTVHLPQTEDYSTARIEYRC